MYRKTYIHFISFTTLQHTDLIVECFSYWFFDCLIGDPIKLGQKLEARGKKKLEHHWTSSLINISFAGVETYHKMHIAGHTQHSAEKQLPT